MSKFFKVIFAYVIAMLLAIFIVMGTGLVARVFYEGFIYGWEMVG